MKFLGQITVVVFMALYSAFAVTLGWEWFIVPFGAPAIGVAHAVGLSAMVTLVTYQSVPKDKSFQDAVLMSVSKVTVCLGLMWLYSQLMPV